MRTAVACLLFVLGAGCGQSLEPRATESSPPAPENRESAPELPTAEPVVIDAPMVLETPPGASELPTVERIVDSGDRQVALSYTVDDAAANTFLRLLNEERTREGLAPLKPYWDLEDDAHAQTERMIDRGEIYHNPGLGDAVAPGVWERLGENVGVGGTPESLHRAFMNSEGHRDNILGDYTHVGIGPQRNEQGTLYVAVVFMKSAVDGIEDTYGPFVDDDFSIHEYGISRIAAEGITVGCDSTGRLFCPDAAVTRGQMAAFLVRAFDLPPSGADRFTDDDGRWYERPAQALAASGVTVGCNQAGTRYCGEDEVTRGQMAVFLTRALNLPPASQDYFDDDAGRFYEDAANRMYESGITRGCGAPNYCGQRSVTRAEMATFLTRALGL